MFSALLLFDDYFPMHSSLKVSFIFSLLILLGCVTIEDASYDIDPKMAIAMKPEFSIFHHSDNESTIYFKLKTEDILYTRNDRSKPFNANLKLAYALYNETGKTLIDSGSILWKDFYTKQKKEFIDTNLLFQLSINNKAKLKLSLTDINRLRIYEKLVDINKRDIFNRQFYLLKDTSGNILMNNFFKGSQVIRLHNNYLSNKQIFMNYNNTIFPIAMPPFSKAKRQTFPRKTSYCKIFDFNHHVDINLPEDGFVYFQLDTMSNQGFSLFNFDRDFPYLKHPRQLIPPLRFLCTSDEYLRLQNGENTKNTVDQFWLSRTSSMERARSLIKTYYSRVEKANEMFTSHVEGWKTDRGMISIIFGPPSYVRKTKNAEVWYYGQQSNANINAYNSINDPMRIQSSGGGLKFTFDKVSNPFSMNDYELDRNYSYKSSWYRAVESWRKGKVYIVQ